MTAEEDFAPIRDDIFEVYYDRVIAPELEAREADRKRAVRSWSKWVLGAFVVSSAVVLFGRQVADLELSAWQFATVIVVCCLMVAKFRIEHVTIDVKDALLPPIAALLDASFSRRTTDAGALERFREQRLIPQFDVSRVEDRISGVRAGARFELFEADLKNRLEFGRSRFDIRVFRGQLLRVAFPRSFLGRTIMLRDTRMLNALRSVGGELQRVGLVDPTFEKIFEVYASDQVEARYLLTPTFMERLLALEALLKGKKARAAFTSGDLLVAIEGGNLFEPGSMFTPLADVDRAKRVLREIEGVHAVIDALLSRNERPRT